MQSKEARPRPRLQVQDNLAGKIVRRWSYFTRYLRAKARKSLIRRFEPILARHFQHEWLEGVRINLRFWPGSEEREFRIRWPGDKFLLRFRWMPWREEACSANWSAPVAVTVLKHGKDGGKPLTVRYMSFFIKNEILYIVQLQGVFMIEMPKGLRDWAERFVKAAMEFARVENLRGVYVVRAEAMYSYHHPTIRSFLPPEVQERERKRIRDNMESYHNQTATALGFVPRGDWFEWQNPDYKPR